jgi:hypothetical protein
MAAGPSIVGWTDHALLRAAEFAISRTDAEAVVVEGHASRRSNTGAGDWRATGRGIVVVYNWPTGDGPLYALLVTLWLAA